MSEGFFGLGIGMGSMVGASDAFTQVLYYFLITIIVGGGVWLYFYWRSFNIKVTVLELAHGGYVRVEDKARQFKNKAGVVQWLLWKHRTDGAMAVPDNDCITITNKGKRSAMCTRSPEGSYNWIKGSSISAFYENFKVTNKDFEPFRSEERTMLVYEYAQAEKYKQKKWTDVAAQVAPLITLAMILAIFMIFFDQAVAPTYEYGNKLVAAGEKMDAAMGKIEAVCLQRPTLPAQGSGFGNVSVLPPN